MTFKMTFKITSKMSPPKAMMGFAKRLRTRPNTQ